MTNTQNYWLQIGMIGSALIGSILASTLATSSINETPSKGYLYGIAIVFLCVILSKILKRIESIAIAEHGMFLMVWLLAHLAGLAGFLLVRPAGLGKDPQFWLYFQSVFGALAGISIVIISRWLWNKLPI